jgi:hypothetical protein
VLPKKLDQYFSLLRSFLKIAQESSLKGMSVSKGGGGNTTRHPFLLTRKESCVQSVTERCGQTLGSYSLYRPAELLSGSHTPFKDAFSAAQVKYRQKGE